MTPFEFISQTQVNWRPSSIEGIGVFAIRDIQKGETLFPVWKGKSGYYRLTKEEHTSLTPEVQELLRRYFINPLHFELIRKEPFLLRQPNIFMNYSETPNVRPIGPAFVAKVDISKNEEIVGDFYTP